MHNSQTVSETMNFYLDLMRYSVFYIMYEPYERLRKIVLKILFHFRCFAKNYLLNVPTVYSLFLLLLSTLYTN